MTFKILKKRKQGLLYNALIVGMLMLSAAVCLVTGDSFNHSCRWNSGLFLNNTVNNMCNCVNSHDNCIF